MNIRNRRHIRQSHQSSERLQMMLPVNDIGPESQLR